MPHGFVNFSPDVPTQCFGGAMSDWKPITANIIQGSGIGPCLLIAYTMDLKHLSSYNTILKYADDTTLFLSLRTHQSLCKLNLLISLIGPTTINSQSTNLRLINCLPSPSSAKQIASSSAPKNWASWPCQGPWRLSIFNSLTCSPYQPFHLWVQPATLSSLLAQIPEFVSWILGCHFQALVLSKITYALPAFAGHISIADRNKINKFFRKAQSWTRYYSFWNSKFNW